MRVRSYARAVHEMAMMRSGSNSSRRADICTGRSRPRTNVGSPARANAGSDIRAAADASADIGSAASSRANADLGDSERDAAGRNSADE
jgi:hypothetical protein